MEIITITEADLKKDNSFYFQFGTSLDLDLHLLSVESQGSAVVADEEGAFRAVDEFVGALSAELALSDEGKGYLPEFVFEVAGVEGNWFALEAVELLSFLARNAEEFYIFLFLAFTANILVIFFFSGVGQNMIFIASKSDWSFFIGCNFHRIFQAFLA